MENINFFIDIDKRFEEIENILSMLENVMREQVFYNISPLSTQRLSPNVIQNMKKALAKGQFTGSFTDINSLLNYNTQLTYLINQPQATGSIGYILNLLLVYLRYLPIYISFDRKIILKNEEGKYYATNQRIIGIEITWIKDDYSYFNLYDPDTSEWIIPPFNYLFKHLTNSDLPKNSNPYIPTNYHVLTITPPIKFDSSSIASIHFDLTSFNIDTVYKELKTLLKNNVSWDTQLEVEMLYDFPLQIDRDWDIDGGWNIDIIEDDAPMLYFVNEFNDLPYTTESTISDTYIIEETW